MPRELFYVPKYLEIASVVVTFFNKLGTQIGT